MGEPAGSAKFPTWVSQDHHSGNDASVFLLPTSS